MESPLGRLFTYTYDAVRRRTSRMNVAGKLTTYTYDAAGRLQVQVKSNGGLTTFTYDEAGRRTLAQKANPTRTSFTYDEANRLLQRYDFESNDDVISGVGYVYDAADNRTSMLDAAGVRTTWAYDASYQLTAEQRCYGWVRQCLRVRSRRQSFGKVRVRRPHNLRLRRRQSDCHR